MEKLNNLLNRLYEATNNDTCMSLIYLIQQIKNATKADPLEVSDQYRVYFDKETLTFDSEATASLKFIYKDISYTIIFTKAEHIEHTEKVMLLDEIRLTKIHSCNLWAEIENDIIRRLEI